MTVAIRVQSCPVSFVVAHRTTLSKLRTNHRSAKHGIKLSAWKVYWLREYALSNSSTNPSTRPSSRSHTGDHRIGRRRELIAAIYVPSMDGMAT